MSALAPFTAHVRVVPHRGQQTKSPNTGAVVTRRGGRWDHVRELQRLAILVYEELEEFGGTETDPVILPEPGGGQHRLRGVFSNVAYGGAVKPQFGNTPAQIMIEGFFNAESAKESDQPAPATTLIHCNEQMSGPMHQKPWLGSAGNPTAAVESEVSTLKSQIELALATINDDDDAVDLTLFRLEYKGITWGDRGHHFV